MAGIRDDFENPLVASLGHGAEAADGGEGGGGDGREGRGNARVGCDALPEFVGEGGVFRALFRAIKTCRQSTRKRPKTWRKTLHFACCFAQLKPVLFMPRPGLFRRGGWR
jgi:hypothetical protein